MEWLKKIMDEKQEYKQVVARVEKLPQEYRFVYKNIQEYMWGYAAGDGYDMVKIHYELLELFESGVAEGKGVLEITGQDVAAFCDELLRNARTYTQSRRDQLNETILKKLGSAEK